MPTVWRAGNYCVHHKIVPNSEYTSANESKPNPGERYDAVDYSQLNKVLMRDYIGTKIRIILEVTYVNKYPCRSIYKPNIDAKNAAVCIIIFCCTFGPGVYLNTNNDK